MDAVRRRGADGYLRLRPRARSNYNDDTGIVCQNFGMPQPVHLRVGAPQDEEGDRRQVPVSDRLPLDDELDDGFADRPLQKSPGRQTEQGQEARE